MISIKAAHSEKDTGISGFRKLLRVLRTVIIVVVLLFVAFIVWVMLSDDVAEPPVPYNPVDNVTVEDQTLIVQSDETTIHITTVSEEEKNAFLANEANGPLVQGVTEEGKEYEGRGDTVFLRSSGVIVQAKPAESGKTDSPAATAGVAAAVTTTPGYTKEQGDWNTGYSTYFIDRADCILFYPAQLKFKSEKNGKITFTDARSKAELIVTLEKNRYEAMDEVEDFLYGSDVGDVLASGTDWYTTLLTEKDKKNELFCYVGLGNDYIVNCSLRYENRYSYVFNDLRGLIRCRFVDDGKWVSNARTDTAGKIVPILSADPKTYDPVIRQTSYYFAEKSCVAYYPDIFTKAYQDDSGIEYFTDPHTGAYISLYLQETELSDQKSLQASMEEFETELVGNRGCKGKTQKNGFGNITYSALLNGNLYVMEMIYPSEYANVYEQAYSFFGVALEGEAISFTEMQDIYYTPFSCNVTIPLQFIETDTDGDVHIFEDAFSGLSMRLTFSEVTDPEEYENLYNAFDVRAEDTDILYGEYYIKWHNQNGAFIGAVGAEYMCLLEIPYPNAYSVYEDCWKRFGINFSDEAQRHSLADEIREGAKVLFESQPEKGSETAPVSDSAVVNASSPADSYQEKHVIVPKERQGDYALLKQESNGIYEKLPFDSVESFEIAAITTGEWTEVSYYVSNDWEDRILRVYEILLENFAPDFYYSDDDSIQVLMSGKPQGLFPDVELIFYCDSTWLNVMFYYDDPQPVVKPGVMMYDYPSIKACWSELDDFSEYREFMDCMRWNKQCLDTWFDCTGLYMRTLYDPFDYEDICDYDYDDTTIGDEWYEGLFVETGHYEGSVFVREHIFKGTAIGELYEVLDDVILPYSH